MTISSDVTRVAYSGNGVTTVFPFAGQFTANSDLLVYERVVATGVFTLLALTADYTVAGAGNPLGGTVTRLVATAIGTLLIIIRAVPFTQPSTWPFNSAIDGPTLEAAFDRSIILNQQMEDALIRTPKLGLSDTDGSGTYNTNSNKMGPGTAGVAATDFIIKSQLDAAVITGAGFTPAAGSITNVPAGGIAAVTVQAAINELDTEKAPIASPTFTGTLTAAAMSVTGALNAAGTVTVVDTNFAITGSVDATKKVRFEADGLTTATTRTVTAPDRDLTLNALTPIMASLGADVALNNTGTFFDGPSIAQGTVGTWFVSGTVSCSDTAGVAQFRLKLWDGTTVIASAVVSSSGANIVAGGTVSGFITNPAGNLRVSVEDATSVNGSIKFNTSGLSKDSSITAIRVG